MSRRKGAPGRRSSGGPRKGNQGNRSQGKAKAGSVSAQPANRDAILIGRLPRRARHDVDVEVVTARRT